VKHIGDKRVGAEFSFAGGQILGQSAGKISFRDCVEFHSLPITSFTIGHGMNSP